MYDQAMIESEVTLIQMVRGSDVGAAQRSGLSASQIAGLACLTCAGSDNLGVAVGWINGEHQVQVHSYHLEDWRSGQPDPST
jgi:hypothetical protein